MIVEVVGRATITEKANMLMIYGKCWENAIRFVCILCTWNISQSTSTILQLFVKVFIQVHKSGSIMPRKRNRDKQMTGEEGEIKVLAAVVVDPQISSRAIASGLHILHRHKCHPYHISLHQGLHMAMILIIVLTLVQYSGIKT